MFERLKRALVESYIGAIALGYVLAQCIFHLVNVFTWPVSGWLGRNEYREIGPRTTTFPLVLLRYALPEFVSFFLLLLVWYVLLRWLYFTPVKKETCAPASKPEQAV
ncbi:MAG: hypothetical protein WBE13_14790 [Candidatus Acidiferrum sp.]